MSTAEKINNQTLPALSAEPEHLDLRSEDTVADKQTELLRLFPDARTEGGKIDFERLKLALGHAVDVGKERYGMNWPGKAECFKSIQAPSLAGCGKRIFSPLSTDTITYYDGFYQAKDTEY